MTNEFRHKDAVGGKIYEDEFENINQHIFNNQVARDIMVASSATQLSRLGAGTRGLPSATIVVAASNSTAAGKALADYVCDGTDDAEEIQAAIGIVGALGGGRVVLLEGSYYIGGVHATGNPGEGIYLKTSNTFLVGQGPGTVLIGSGAQDNAVLLLVATGAGDEIENIGVMNLRITAPLAQMDAANFGCNAIAIGTAVGATSLIDVLVQNVWIDDIYLNTGGGGGKGISLLGDANDEVLNVTIENLWLRDCDFTGIDDVHLTAGTYPLRNLIITNFSIKDCGEGMQISQGKVYDMVIAHGQIEGGTYGLNIASPNASISDINVTAATNTGVQLGGANISVDSLTIRACARNFRVTTVNHITATNLKLLDSTAEEGGLVVGDDCYIQGSSSGNTKEGLKLQVSERCTVHWESDSDGFDGVFINGCDLNDINVKVYKAQRHGLQLFDSDANRVKAICVDNGQATDNVYVHVAVTGTSTHNKVSATCRSALATNVKNNMGDFNTADYNTFKDCDLSGAHTSPAVFVGTHNTYDCMPMSGVLDLSAAGTDIVAYNATTDCVLAGYAVLYTEASSADAGVNIRIGRYQDGVALDDDYFDIAASEASKDLGYKKTYVSADLTQTVIAAGDTITVGNVGGKTGTGEVQIILFILENAS